MTPRKQPQATLRTMTANARALHEAGVRAALRDRRRRRAEEAGMQSLVRSLATQMPPVGGGR